MARGSGRLWPASPWASQAPGLCCFTSDKRVSLASHLGRGSGRAGLVEGPWASSLGTGSVIRGVQPRARLGQGGRRGVAAHLLRDSHMHTHTCTRRRQCPRRGARGPAASRAPPFPPQWSYGFYLIHLQGKQGFQFFCKTEDMKRKWMEQFEMAM